MCSMKEKLCRETKRTKQSGRNERCVWGQGIQSTHKRLCNIVLMLPRAICNEYIQLKLKNNQKGKLGFTPISFFKRGIEWRVQKNSPSACEPTLFKFQNSKFQKIFKRIDYSRTLIYPSSLFAPTSTI